MLVLLDRDGVINTNLPTSVHRVADFTFIPRSLDAIAMLTKAGMRLGICTNQSCVGRGTISAQTLAEIHAHMLAKIRAHGGDIAQIYAATDHPDNASNRRKPGDGMLREALTEFAAIAADTYFVGDSLTDLQAAASADCKALLVRTGHGKVLEDAGIDSRYAPVMVVNDLYDAAAYILAQRAR